MIEQLQQHLSRPVRDFLQHSGAVQALLTLFGALHADNEDEDTAIAWETGEDDQDDFGGATPAAH